MYLFPLPATLRGIVGIAEDLLAMLDCEVQVMLDGIHGHQETVGLVLMRAWRQQHASRGKWPHASHLVESQKFTAGGHVHQPGHGFYQERRSNIEQLGWKTHKRA